MHVHKLIEHHTRTHGDAPNSRQSLEPKQGATSSGSQEQTVDTCVT